MEENKLLIKRYLERNPTYSITKIKNTSIFVKDGSLNGITLSCVY